MIAARCCCLRCLLLAKSNKQLHPTVKSIQLASDHVENSRTRRLTTSELVGESLPHTTGSCRSTGRSQITKSLDDQKAVCVRSYALGSLFNAHKRARFWKTVSGLVPAAHTGESRQSDVERAFTCAEPTIIKARSPPACQRETRPLYPSL